MEYKGCCAIGDTFWHNPQYVIRLDDPDEDDEEGNCTVIIALLQKNRRSRRNMGVECLTIGFAVYRVTERDLAQKPLKMNFFKYNASAARSPAFINLREVSCRFKLPPGTYVIVPSTFEPNEEGEFIIRVFSETANSMMENDDNVGVGDLDDRVSGRHVCGCRWTLTNTSLPFACRLRPMCPATSNRLRNGKPWSVCFWTLPERTVKWTGSS